MIEQIIHVGKDEYKLIPLEWNGGDSQEHQIMVYLDEPGAVVDVVGVLQGRGEETFSCQTTVVHVAPKTISRTLVRGVLRDGSKSFVRGMVKIEHGAKGSKAGFEARALMLSKQTKAECVPDLEILENDVLGATHAASVGPVDEEQLFYLMSRGLDRVESQEVLTEAFLWPARALLEQKGLQVAGMRD